MRLDTRRTFPVAVFLGLAMAYYYFALFLPVAHAVLTEQRRDKGYIYGCDFYPLWLTTRDLVCCRLDPYTPDTTRKIQIGLYGRTLDSSRPDDPPTNYRAFVYPLYTDVVALPVAWLPFPYVQVAGAFLFPVLIVVSVFLWIRALDLRFSLLTRLVASVLVLTSYPSLEGIYALQPGVLAATLLAGSVLALSRKRLALSGILIGIASIKPQLIVLVALWFLAWTLASWSARKRLMIGMLGTWAVLFGIGALIQPGWPGEWMSTVAAYRTYTDAPLAEAVMGKTLALLLKLILLLVGLVAAWRARAADPTTSAFQSLLVWLLATTVVVIPSSLAVYDQLLLLPGVLWLVWRHRDFENGTLRLRIIGMLAVGALCWPWFAAVIVDAVSWVSPSLARHSQVLALPLRTAASFPLIVLTLISLVMGKQASKMLETSV